MIFGIKSEKKKNSQKKREKTGRADHERGRIHLKDHQGRGEGPAQSMEYANCSESLAGKKEGKTTGTPTGISSCTTRGKEKTAIGKKKIKNRSKKRNAVDWGITPD